MAYKGAWEQASRCVTGLAPPPSSWCCFRLLGFPPLSSTVSLHGEPRGSPFPGPSLTLAGRPHGHGVREGLHRLLRRRSPRTGKGKHPLQAGGNNISKGQGMNGIDLPVPGQPGPRRPVGSCNQALGLSPQGVGAPQPRFGLFPAKLPFLSCALISVSQSLRHILPWSSQSSDILIYIQRN